MLCSVLASVLLNLPAKVEEIAYMRNGEVRVIGADGKADRLLITTDYDRPLVWYPNGKRLIYRHDSKEFGWQMYWIEVDSKRKGELTKNRTKDNRSASFSPDGKQIAFISGPIGLCLMDQEGKSIRNLGAEAQRDMTPAWSADGKRIFFESEGSGPSQVSVYDLATSKSQNMARGMMQQTAGHWMFMVKSGPGGSELWRRDLTSAQETKWLGAEWQAWHYCVSPNGQSVAFYGPSAKPGLYVSDGMKTTKVAPATADCIQSLQFSRDGKSIAFTTGVRNHEEIWIADVQRQSARRLVKGVWPSWRPN